MPQYSTLLSPGPLQLQMEVHQMKEGTSINEKE